MSKVVTITILLLIGKLSFSQIDSTTLSADDSTIIGFAKYDLYQKLPEGSLGNFVADAVKTAVQLKWGNKIDIAIVSPQSIRGKIEKGTFKKNQILQLLPYPDSIAILKADSAQVKNILDKIASEGGGAVSGLQMQINNMRADSILINKDLLNNKENYMLAVPYFLLLKKKISLEKNTIIFNANLSIQNAVCEYVMWLTNKGMTISPISYRRIKYSN